MNKNDISLAFLPFAHILGRVESLLPLMGGYTLAFAENVNTIIQDIALVRPTLLVSVPRIFEKIYSKISGDISTQPKVKKDIFQWAVKVGRAVAKHRSEKKSIPISLLLKYRVADKLVFKKIQEKLGGRLRLSVSGGAPLAAELCEFFHAAGIKIVEGYGLTETTAAITCNYPEDYCFGTVGKPLGNTEIRLAADGEIQLKGDMIFKGYYNNPEATKEVFTADGWFCTGDIGEFTPRGFLKITDRKKEIIVTSAGKNVAPQKLENMLKQLPYISHAMVYGDKQKYLTALVTINEPDVKKWATASGISFKSMEDLVNNEVLVKIIETEIRNANLHLASFETIKKFKILPHDFTIETGELTPSLKIKRKVCVQKYKHYIEEMYQ